MSVISGLQMERLVSENKYVIHNKIFLMTLFSSQISPLLTPVNYLTVVSILLHCVVQFLVLVAAPVYFSLPIFVKT